jgi:hypothetical protein
VNPAWRTTPSVIPITAGPIAAPAIALAACAEATTQTCCETKINPEAATVNSPARITHARLRVVASITAPAGTAASSPAIRPTVVTAPIRAGRPPATQQQDPQKRADTGLHIGHKEVHRLQRRAITGAHARR